MTGHSTGNKEHWFRNFLKALEKYQPPCFVGRHHLGDGGDSPGAHFVGAGYNQDDLSVCISMHSLLYFFTRFQLFQKFLILTYIITIPLLYLNNETKKQTFLSAMLPSEIITHSPFPWTSPQFLFAQVFFYFLSLYLPSHCIL